MSLDPDSKAAHRYVIVDRTTLQCLSTYLCPGEGGNVGTPVRYKSSEAPQVAKMLGGVMLNHDRWRDLLKKPEDAA